MSIISLSDRAKKAILLIADVPKWPDHLQRTFFPRMTRGELIVCLIITGLILAIIYVVIGQLPEIFS